MESTPNVEYYSTKDYPQLEFAVKCGIRSSFVLPLFQPNSWESVGVLEIVDSGQYRSFPMRQWTIAKNIFELSPLKAQARLPFESQIVQGTEEDKVLTEINKAMEVVCTTHRLPFAQIWTPCRPSSAMDYADSSESSCYTSYLWSLNRFPSIFQIDDLRVYSDLVNFKGTCNNDNFLRNGQGVVGKALLYCKPCFCRDVSQLPIAEYPLSHHTRYYGLTGCFAIGVHIKSHNYYVLEFFLPPWNPTSGDQRNLLESIFPTVKNHLQGFEIGLGGGKESDIEVLNISVDNEQDSFKICQSIGIQPISEPSLQDEREEVPNKVTGEAVIIDSDGRSDLGVELNKYVAPVILEDEIEKYVGEELCVEVAKTATDVEMTTRLPPMTETLENERELVQLSDDESAMEVNVVVIPEQNGREETSSEREYRRIEGPLSREDLNQHFGKTLDHAAKILGVCRSTMKRACRVHGIKKWPFPKRKKVLPSPSNLKHVNKRVSDGLKQIPRFGNSETSCSNPPPMNTTSVVAHTIPNLLPKQDEGSVTVKATYGAEMIRFRLSFSSRKADLMEKVTQRLPLKGGTDAVHPVPFGG